MYVAVDVQYAADDTHATVAGVLFRDPVSHVVDDERIVGVGSPKPYVPGQFYQREMPCILELMKRITTPIDAVFIDGYVDLGPRAGLGRHLYIALRGEISVIGVAKRFFKESAAIEVKRGQSERPLFVTAVGLEAPLAANMVEDMHGPFRIPTLLKRADSLSRGVAHQRVKQDVTTRIR
jgi:deoxyribonuclease V